MTTTYTYTDTQSESSEESEFLGALNYQQPENAKKDDFYISSISVYAESEGEDINEPGVEVHLTGSLQLYRYGRYSGHAYTVIDLDSRSIVRPPGAGDRAGERINAINMDQVIEDIECLLIG